MTSRERLLAAINNEKPDRLPCQVHNWMQFYLKNYLDGRDAFQAYEYFTGMDWVIYAGPEFCYHDTDLANWQVDRQDLGKDEDGNNCWQETITTPDGQLTRAGAHNEITGWETKHLIETEADFAVWEKYCPIPEQVDWTPVIEIKNRIGDRGIVRSGYFGFGQGSPWQDFCILIGTQPAIMATFDSPDWVHHVLKTLLEKKLQVIDRGGKIEFDLIETGGGAGSSTVISPDLQREFGIPYDLQQHQAIHDQGGKAVYHLCGGLMPMLDLVVENGADGLETMTPPTMGGDCDLAAATEKVGDKLFFIGGFDQNRGFENGTPEIAAQLVRECFTACPNGGYICSPSDHFFHGEPKNVQAFVDEAINCQY